MSEVLMVLWNPMAAGAPVMAAAFAEALHAAGHRITLAHGAPPNDTAQTVLPRFEALGATLVPLPPMSGTGVVRTVARLRDVIHAERAEVVIGFQQRDRSLAVLAARLAGVPAMVHCGAPVTFAGRGPLTQAKQFAHRAVMSRWADLVVCPSPAVQRSATDVLGVPVERAPVVFNGVDTARVAESAAAGRQAGWHREHPRAILIAGRLHPSKGHDLLLEALRTVPGAGTEWKLAVVGEVTGHQDASGFAASIRRLAEEAPLAGAVEFLGWRNDVTELMGRCDVYVQPSRTEGWSLAISEALAAGCAVVFSDCSGRPPGFTDGEHGWVVPTGDTDTLAATFRHVLSLSEPELDAVRTAAASYAAEHLDITRCAAEFVAMTEATIRSRAGRR